MAYETLEIDREGPLARVTLARPEKRIALNPTLASELAALLRALEPDDDVRVVAIRGSGGNFCSGGDLAPDGKRSRRRSASPAVTTLDLMNRVYGDAIRTLHRFPKPIVAIVEGSAAGAGANLAFACDLVYAAKSARFSEIFVKRGLGLDCGGSWLLPRLIGLQRAKELAFFGDWISAEEARTLGLVTGIYEDAELEAATSERLATLAARAPIALQQIKQSLHRAMDLGMNETLEIEALAQATCASTEDATEGFMAFAEKREPRFQGR